MDKKKKKKYTSPKMDVIKLKANPVLFDDSKNNTDWGSGPAG